MRTGSEAIAPSRAARWEIDLSAGARSLPESPPAGSKRMFIGGFRSCPRHREAELGDQRERTLDVLLAGDPQRDDTLAVVFGGRQRHVDDVDASAAARERDVGNHAE